jgi:hypothetical protein
VCGQNFSLSCADASFVLQDKSFKNCFHCSLDFSLSLSHTIGAALSSFPSKFTGDNPAHRTLSHRSLLYLYMRFGVSNWAARRNALTDRCANKDRAREKDLRVTVRAFLSRQEKLALTATGVVWKYWPGQRHALHRFILTLRLTKTNQKTAHTLASTMDWGVQLELGRAGARFVGANQPSSLRARTVSPRGKERGTVIFFCPVPVCCALVYKLVRHPSRLCPDRFSFSLFIDFPTQRVDTHCFHSISFNCSILIFYVFLFCKTLKLTKIVRIIFMLFIIYLFLFFSVCLIYHTLILMSL